MLADLPAPTSRDVRRCLDEWQRLENYRLQERSLSLLFHKLCQLNEDIDEVLLKVSALNDFYSTKIFDTYSVARHIVSLEIDRRLSSGDLSVVGDIAAVTIKGKLRNFYSFATKYCSHHRHDIYPIFDSYVEKMLHHFRKRDKFTEFDRPELRNYTRFVTIIHEFRSFYLLDEFSLREIDIFLWLDGKKHFGRGATPDKMAVDTSPHL